MTETPQEISQLKHLITSPQWKVLMDITERVKNHISQNSSLGDSNDDTLMKTYLKEGKLQGINHLIQEIFKIASSEQ